MDVRDNRAIDFARRRLAEMQERALDCRYRFSDGTVIEAADVVCMPAGTTGIFTLATDLRGPEIYLDLKLRPAFVHEFLSIMTDKVIERQEYLRSTYSLEHEGTYICGNSSALLSPDDYRAFVVPVNQRYKEHFGGRCTLHCDGRANHLLPIFADELRISCFWSFGYQDDKVLVAGNLGGKAVLVGNISPMNIAHGTPQSVIAETLEALRVFAPLGGYVIQDGSNIPPGAPVLNINAMAEAACIFSNLQPM
ncbi:MAG: hypothetical protein GX601_04730 [Anaerolineales bacterium]|nr:hypothetical protein [Anaerolineales bacterium]